MFSWDWAPVNWALCNGATLPVAQNQALYSLISNYFGGTKPNFALPDLRGRAMVGLTTNSSTNKNSVYAVMGTTAGAESITLTTSQLPQHTHATNVVTAAADRPVAAGNLFAQVAPAASTNPTIGIYAGQSSPTVTLAAGTVSPAGSSSSHDNMQPFAVANYCIATVGIYPPRQ